MSKQTESKKKFDIFHISDPKIACSDMMMMAKKEEGN